MQTNVKKSSKSKSKQNPQLNSLARGSAVSVIMFWGLLAVFAAVAYKAGLPRNTYLALLLIAALISSFAGGFSAVRRERKDGIMLGTLSSVISVIIFASVSTALGGFTGGILIPAAAMLLAGAFGGIFAANKKRKRS